MPTADGEGTGTSGGDPLLVLLRDQIQAQREVAGAMTQYAEALARWQGDMGGMKRTADDAIRALERATEIEAKRIAAEAAEREDSRNRYDGLSRVVSTPWVSGIGGALALWLLQRMGIAIDASTLPGVAP